MSNTGEGIIPTQASPRKPAKAPAVEVDLSRRIEQAVEREPNDLVRCSRVFGAFYRCNWWDRIGRKKSDQNFDWAGLITDHVRISRFLKVTVQGGDLVIEEVQNATEL